MTKVNLPLCHFPRGQLYPPDLQEHSPCHTQGIEWTPASFLPAWKVIPRILGAAERPFPFQHRKVRLFGKQLNSSCGCHRCPLLAPPLFPPAFHLTFYLDTYQILSNPAATMPGLTKGLHHLSYFSIHIEKEKYPFPLISAKAVDNFLRRLLSRVRRKWEEKFKSLDVDELTKHGHLLQASKFSFQADLGSGMGCRRW